MYRFLCLAIGAVIGINLASAAIAKPSLREVPYVYEGLFDVAVADLIRKGCNDIDGRVFKGISVLRDLQRHAKSLGYSNAEIEAFIESDVEKDRMRARGAEEFAARGMSMDNPDDLCRFGRQEIAEKSTIGVLLRAK